MGTVRSEKSGVDVKVGRRSLVRVWRGRGMVK